MANKCKVGGCDRPQPPLLEDTGLCLHHFLDDIQERCASLSRQLELDGLTSPLREAIGKFIYLSAAKIATVGMESPPEEQFARGRLLNAMLMLAELRDRFDKAARRSPAS